LAGTPVPAEFGFVATIASKLMPEVGVIEYDMIISFN
jgi:hypothetical protein